jgi:hypothetical protein
MSLNDKFEELERWIDVLNDTVKGHKQEIIDTIDGKIKLLDAFPSKESQAELVFRQIEKRMLDVISCASDIRKEIGLSGYKMCSE